jgi:hypothetical protein
MTEANEYDSYGNYCTIGVNAIVALGMHPLAHMKDLLGIVLHYCGPYRPKMYVFQWIWNDADGSTVSEEGNFCWRTERRATIAGLLYGVNFYKSIDSKINLEVADSLLKICDASKRAISEDCDDNHLNCKKHAPVQRFLEQCSDDQLDNLFFNLNDWAGLEIPRTLQVYWLQIY